MFDRHLVQTTTNYPIIDTVVQMKTIGGRRNSLLGESFGISDESCDIGQVGVPN